MRQVTLNNALILLCCCIVVCKSASVINFKGEKEALEMIEEIKRCMKAAKSLENDLGNSIKSSAFLSYCDKFLRRLKITESQKATLAKIGYNIDDIVGDKNFGLDSVVEGDKSKQSNRVESTSAEEQKPVSVDENAEETKASETGKLESKDIDVHQNEIITTQVPERQDMAIPFYQEQHVPVNPAPENIQGTGMPQDSPPINYPGAQPIFQDNVANSKHMMEYGQNIPHQEAQFQQTFPPQIDPILNVQPFIQDLNQQPPHGASFVPGVAHPDILWNQQGIAQHQQQQFQAVPNPQFLNQPLEGGFIHQQQFDFNIQPRNVPIDNLLQQGNNLFPNPNQQPVGFNPQANAFGQVNFVPQANNIPPWDGQFAQQQPNAHVQNYFPPNNEPQNFNNPQDFQFGENNNRRKIEL